MGCTRSDLCLSPPRVRQAVGQGRDAISVRCVAASAPTCLRSSARHPRTRCLCVASATRGTASARHRAAVLTALRKRPLGRRWASRPRRTIGQRRSLVRRLVARRRRSAPSGPPSGCFDDKGDHRHLEGAQEHQRPHCARRDRERGRPRPRPARIVQLADDGRQNACGDEPAKQVAAQDCVGQGGAPRDLVACRTSLAALTHSATKTLEISCPVDRRQESATAMVAT